MVSHEFGLYLHPLGVSDSNGVLCVEIATRRLVSEPSLDTSKARMLIALSLQLRFPAILPIFITLSPTYAPY